MSHIAFMIPGLARIGGAESQLVLLALALRKQGWQVSVLAMSGEGGRAAEKLRQGGCSFVSLQMIKGWADPRGWWKLVHWLHRERPDLVHAHLPHAVWMARWSRLLVARRVEVETLHTSAPGPASRQSAWRRSEWLSDQVTAVSHAVAHAQGGRSIRDASKVTVLPNAIDTGLWQPRAELRTVMRQQLGMADACFLWIAAGRLEAVKDYPTLLEAFARLDQRARLLIAGEGSQRAQLEARAQELGIGSRVRFLGSRQDLQELLQAADGFVQASLWEGLPLSLLEAGACGVPAVATHVAGNNEVVVHGKTGLLAAVSSANALAGAMSSLMVASNAERRAMGEQARQRVVEEFGLHTVLDKWLALYDALLTAHPEPSHYAMQRQQR